MIATLQNIIIHTKYQTVTQKEQILLDTFLSRES